MIARPSKTFMIMATLALVVFGAFFVNRRQPVCAGDGKYMSTVSECKAWGVSAESCQQAVDKARALAAAKSPKIDDKTQCEMRFTDCLPAPNGGYVPLPSFCLRTSEQGAEPTEIRYVQFDSDRRNRRVTREVRLDP